MTQRKLPRESGRRGVIWLLLHVVLNWFSYGAMLIPAAVWLAPVFSLRYVRTQPLVRGLGLFYIATTIPLYFQLQGIIPIPQPAYAVFVTVAALPWVAIYALDRWLSPRLPGLLSTLVYPTAIVSLEYFNSFGEWGSFGSVAYTQISVLPLVQLGAVTGMWGIIFLVTWFPALVNWVWELDWQWRTVRPALALAVGVYVLAFGFGYSRLMFAPGPESTLRVAAIPSDALSIAPAMAFMNDPSADARAALRTELAASNARLLERTRAEAQAGAQMVAWAEGNAVVLAEDATDLVAAGQAAAQDESIYLLMAVAVLHPEAERFLENKLIMLDPGGTIVWEYWKAFPVPGPELAASFPGSTVLPVHETPWGRVSGVICFDMDHHYFIRQAGLDGVNLLFAPSNDWPDIAQIHMEQAIMRAIENGFTLIRPTSNGLSVAADPYGRILGVSDDAITGGGTLVSQVGVYRLSTPYQWIGDGFAWAMLTSLIILIGLGSVAAWRERRVRRATEGPAGDLSVRAPAG